MGMGSNGANMARDEKRNLLTIRRQSIFSRNSLSRTLSSVTGIPPTLAYRLLVQKVSHRPLLATVMDAIMKRWQVSEESVNSGIRAQI